MGLSFSFIVPVYNRPEEIRELLESLVLQTFNESFEVLIVEDGSSKSSKSVVSEFQNKLNISYYEKENTGPGASRNYGMERAKGNYFIILDSDCILPTQYLKEVEKSLKNDFVHCFGGPDAAHESFSPVQKSINYAMTSVLTTGGIRGNKNTVGKSARRTGGFQPRSFNMGISKEAFETVGGFSKIHPGEDPDLSFRIWKAGYKTKLVPEAFVYHKRRIDWGRFYTQVNKFGLVRPILNKWHPGTAKVTYWFPTFFSLFFLASLLLYFLNISFPLWLFAGYFIIIFFDSLLKNKSLVIALLSLVAVVVQFSGYGLGFLKSTILVNFSKKKPEELFPNLFFK